MITKPWWEQHPGRLQSELRALDDAGIVYEQDEPTFDKGVLRLRLKVPLNGTDVKLCATYPDMYPYFRVEVTAPDLNLRHHQNPFQKNLCLIGRSTDLWHSTNTLASLLCEQLATVVDTGSSDDTEMAAELEEHQAEPYAGYFAYQPGASVIIGGEGAVDASHQSGKLLLGLEHNGHAVLRAALLEVQDENSNILWQAEQPIRAAYSVAKITGRWVRLDLPPKSDEPARVFRYCYDADPSPDKIDSFPSGDAQLQVRAALFPQEIRAWRKAHYGWLFVCRLEPSESWKAWTRCKKKKGSSNTRQEEAVRRFAYYLAPAYYASPEDVRQRIPELHPLRDKSIAVVGLGCLGAPSAIEFVKAGIQDLRLVDHDSVDPATSVRWQLGFRAAGHNKADLLHDIICRDYPYTASQPLNLRIGRVRSPESEPESDLMAIERIFDGVDVIYDSTAELGVQHYLSDWAWAHGITYIGLAGRLGGWGGKVFRIRPSPEKGCWQCYRWHCHRGTIPEPPSAPDDEGNVQPTGCADPTFTGAGFDMLEIALAGVRLTISTLCEGQAKAYPDSGWDAIHIRLRGDDGSLVPPVHATYPISRHPECLNSHAYPGQK